MKNDTLDQQEASESMLLNEFLKLLGNSEINMKN